MEHQYNVDLNWVTGREGILYAPDLNDEIEVATPPPFPKGVPNVWSPEHLLTAAVSSCFMTTFLAIAENSHLEFKKLSIHASGKLEMVDGKYMISEVELVPTLTIENGSDQEKALRVLAKSEANCLISNSVKAKIIFQPKVVVPGLSGSAPSAL